MSTPRSISVFLPEIQIPSVLYPSYGERRGRNPSDIIDAKIRMRADVCTGLLAHESAAQFGQPLTHAAVRFVSWGYRRSVSDTLYALQSAIGGIADAGLISSAYAVYELTGRIKDDGVTEGLLVEVEDIGNGIDALPHVVIP